VLLVGVEQRTDTELTVPDSAAFFVDTANPHNSNRSHVCCPLLRAAAATKTHTFLSLLLSVGERTNSE
jgi:hypothetical protein